MNIKYIKLQIIKNVIRVSLETLDLFYFMTNRFILHRKYISLLKC